jgi:hypothetical protein
MLPKLALAFKAALPVIALIAAATALAAKAVGGTVKAQKEFSDNVKKAKETRAALSSTVEKATASISGRQKGTAALRLVFEKLADGIKTISQPALDGVKTALDFIGGGISWVADKFGIVSTAEQEAAINAQKLVEQNNALLESYKANETELANIETALKTNAIMAEEADKRKLTSAESYLQKLIELRTATAAQVGETSKEAASYDEAIAAQVRLRDSYAETVKANEEARKASEAPKEKSDQRKIEEARLAAVEKYEQAVRKANKVAM